MMHLSFGEQVKIILSRKGMTIKELAERVQAYTGKNMSRQNMTQRLGRDNFQEQDMRMIAEILGCSFQLSIMEGLEEKVAQTQTTSVKEVVQTDTIPVKEATQADTTLVKEVAQADTTSVKETVQADMTSKEEMQGEINPYTGKEYQSNSVRMHPTRLGYVQVYDRSEHKWTDMTEWAFLGFQERKKALLGKDYQPPVYLD